MSYRHSPPLRSADLAYRKTTSLLNKLASSNFESISGQIVAIITNQSESEDHNKILSLILDTATVQPGRSELYAQLFSSTAFKTRKMWFHLKLRRSFLAVFQKLPDVQQLEKTRRLGLVRFIGEVSKLGLVSKAMLSTVGMKPLDSKCPLDVELESLCVLLKTIGVLSEPFIKDNFTRILQLSSNSQIPMRLRFMLQDIIDLRARNWMEAPRTRSDDPIPTPLKGEIDEGTHLGDAESSRLADKIKNILTKKELKHAERQLSSLPRHYVPTAIQMLVERVLLNSTSAPFVAEFLASASAQDLVFTTDVELGFRRALTGRHFDGEEMAPLLSMLEAAGFNDERGSSLLADSLAGGTSGADDENIDLHPLGAMEVFEAISASLSIPEPNFSPLGRLPKMVFREWLAQYVTPLRRSVESVRDEEQQQLKSLLRIEELQMTLARERQETIALRSEVERLSDQLTKSVENNQKLAQESEVVKKTRNAEQMRRVEMEDRLKAKEGDALSLKADLQQAQSRCQILEAVVQRSRIDEEVRRNAEISAMSAGREEGRDGMLTELIRLLTSKREDERRAREAEAERVDRERAEKIRHEAEAKRKTEQQRGAERERSRCLKRDEKYTSSRLWTAALAFERFETILLAEEFAKFKFSDSTPLTCEALPWPIFTKPWTYNVNDINADKVRAFFKSPVLMTAKSPAYPVPSEYRKYLLKQSLLAFHGDKMVHRISTVVDDNLRQQISDAAHLVTQTLNELMQRDH
ncbi:hypothetical protein C8R44DRAFT_886925 [Mycena epipterygia]|nr:hypothetical protein C8R44DRAFT_886925 [Mycena epipterygia]